MKNFLSISAMSQDYFVKLELSDKNILLCPTFRLEQKSTVGNARLKSNRTRILKMSINELSAEVGFGSSLMDCHEQVFVQLIWGFANCPCALPATLGLGVAGEIFFRLPSP
jgi:hypothetical protein